MKLITNKSRLKFFPKGQIIFYQGDDMLEVFMIKSGIVKIHDIDEQGSEKILHLTKAPAVLPFAFFSGLDAKPHWFYTALTDCELYVISPKELLQAMKENHQLAISLTNEFSRDVHELLVRLSSLGKTKAQDKLVATLNFLSELHSKPKNNKWRQVTFTVNHQLLADIAGITRERASMVMKELQDLKAVRSPKMNVLEINPTRLNELG